MIQCRHRSGFLFEAAQTILIARQSRREDFDGNVALEALIACAVDFTHAASAQERLDFVRAEFCAGVSDICAVSIPCTRYFRERDDSELLVGDA